MTGFGAAATDALVKYPGPAERAAAKIAAARSFGEHLYLPSQGMSPHPSPAHEKEAT